MTVNDLKRRLAMMPGSAPVEIYIHGALNNDPFTVRMDSETIEVGIMDHNDSFFDRVVIEGFAREPYFM